MVTNPRWIEFTFCDTTLNWRASKMLTVPNIVMPIGFTDINLVAGFTCIFINNIGTQKLWNTVLKGKTVSQTPWSFENDSKVTILLKMF